MLRIILMINPHQNKTHSCVSAFLKYVNFRVEHVIPGRGKKRHGRCKQRWSRQCQTQAGSGGSARLPQCHHTPPAERQPGWLRRREMEGERWNQSQAWGPLCHLQPSLQDCAYPQSAWKAKYDCVNSKLNTEVIRGQFLYIKTIKIKN